MVLVTFMIRDCHQLQGIPYIIEFFQWEFIYVYMLEHREFNEQMFTHSIQQYP